MKTSFNWHNHEFPTFDLQFFNADWISLYLQVEVPGASHLCTGSPHTSIAYCDAPFETPDLVPGFFIGGKPAECDRIHGFRHWRMTHNE